MKDYKKIMFCFMIFLCCSIFIVYPYGWSKQDESGAKTDEIYRNLEIFSEVIRQIQENYVEKKTSKELIQNAIKGMVGSLDPHSQYMTKEEHQELIIETKGSFTGVGIEITMKDNVLTVVSPIEGTPAFKAGIKAGDRIIKINGKSTVDMTLMDAVKLIRGPKGTKVKLTIKREGVKEPIDFEIVRDVIPLKTVKKHMLTPNIAYIRISSFQGNTLDDLQKALSELEKKFKIKGLILDLRNNPGGLLTQAIKVSDLFLDSGIIVSTKGRNGSQNMVVKAHKGKYPQDFPMIVLVNGGSASAAEIVAGALQDNNRALILGTKTFGKGSVQTIIPLSDGSALKLTTARYYTPSGRSIQLSGIIPDIEVEFRPTKGKEIKGKKKRHFIREEDLKGHIDVESNKKNRKQGLNLLNDEKVKKLVRRDNQVRYALQLLQNWNKFSRINDNILVKEK